MIGRDGLSGSRESGYSPKEKTKKQVAGFHDFTVFVHYINLRSHSIRLPSGNTTITFSLSVTVVGGNESLNVS